MHVNTFTYNRLHVKYLEDIVLRSAYKQYLFISVFNQLGTENLFQIKFYFMPLHVSSTCAHHQEVKIALHSLWYHQTYRTTHLFQCDMFKDLP